MAASAPGPANVADAATREVTPLTSPLNQEGLPGFGHRRVSREFLGAIFGDPFKRLRR